MFLTCLDVLLSSSRNNPESNKWPDPSNFLFLSQIYGGVNVTTGDLVSSMSSVQDQGDEEQVAEEEDHKDDKRRGRRRTSIIYHKQSSKRGLRRANSKVILTESEQRRTRRVLRANEHFEVHQVDGDDEDEIVNLQVYLLV